MDKAFDKRILAKKNILSDHGRFYKYPPREDFLLAYAEKLVDTPDHILNSVLNQLGETAGKDYPTLATIRSMTSQMYKARDKQDDYLERVRKENERYEKLYSQMLETLGQEAMDKYFRYWLREEFGSILEDYQNYGIDLKIFHKCAIFDLQEGRDPQKAVEAGLKKFNKAQEQMIQSLPDDYWDIVLRGDDNAS